MERQELLALAIKKLRGESREIIHEMARRQDLLPSFKERLANFPEGEVSPSVARLRKNLLEQIQEITTYTANAATSLEMIALLLELLDKEARRQQQEGPMLPGFEEGYCTK